MQTLTQNETKALNKVKKSMMKTAKSNAQFLINYIKDSADIRQELKNRDIKTRLLKKDNTNYQEIIINHYINYVNEKINNYVELLQDETIPELKNIYVSVIWVKNNTWGMNPQATAYINNILCGCGRASGCGYDKLSAAVDSAIYNNKTFRKAIIKRSLKAIIKNEALPYGVYADSCGIYASFNGCGISTFRNICEWLGLKNFTHNETKTSDFITVY